MKVLVSACLLCTTLLTSPALRAAPLDEGDAGNRPGVAQAGEIIQVEQVDSQGAQELALRVFLDCDRDCDFDYLRREITFVNYVRDRRDAEVHVLVTQRETGSGGREFTLDFIGLEEFEGDEHVLVFASSEPTPRTSRDKISPERSRSA